jgi:hypothetical protein
MWLPLHQKQRGSCLQFIHTNKPFFESSLPLRPTGRRPVSFEIKHPSRAYDQIFITVRELRVWWCGALSLTRGRVCRLQLLMSLASAAIFGSESLGTREYILLSPNRDIPFRRLLRLAELTWRYSTYSVIEPATFHSVAVSTIYPTPRGIFMLVHRNGMRRNQKESKNNILFLHSLGLIHFCVTCLTYSSRF